MWETESELHAELARHGLDPEQHLLVDDDGSGGVVGVSGFLHVWRDGAAGLVCPVVERGQRGRGAGGRLLRAALAHGAARLGVRAATAGIGTRNRAGYALLAAHGFRPVRQHFLLRCDARPEPGGSRAPGLEMAPAGPGDLSALHELYRACGFEPRPPEETARRLSGAGFALALASRGGKVVAFAELETHWPRRCWVAYVGVDPGVRARGVGSSLVAWAVAREFERGAEQALLVLSPANREALRAYEKVGFRLHRSFDVLERAVSPP
jgi:ribosomal protein S18 acetylase RimI-like enzyme